MLRVLAATTSDILVLTLFYFCQNFLKQKGDNQYALHGCEVAVTAIGTPFH